MTEKPLLDALRLRATAMGRITCRKCAAEKDASEFNKCAAKVNGLQSYCRQCSSGINKSIYDDDREGQIARSAGWNRKNPKRVAENMWKARRRQPGHFKEYADNYRAENPDKIALYQKRRGERRKGINTNIPIAAWRNLVAVYGGRCYYCGQLGASSKDHRVPLSKGGEHSVDNIVLSCLTCDSRKHALSVKEFSERYYGCY